MQNLVLSNEKIELVLSANLEIIAGLRPLLAGHVRQDVAASVLAALVEFRAGLLGMRDGAAVSPETIEQAQASHAEITIVVTQACEGKLPAQLAEILEQFAIGLTQLAAS